MRKASILFGLLLVFGAVSAFAQAGTTGTGTLTATATVTPSLQLVFTSDASGPTLTGSGTSAATLAFGTVSAFSGTFPSGGISRTVGASDFTVSAPFDVTVTAANSTSTAYTLTATVTDTSGPTWTIGATNITGTTGTLTSAGTFGSAAPYTLNLKVPFSQSTNLSISKAISFTATSN